MALIACRTLLRFLRAYRGMKCFGTVVLFTVAFCVLSDDDLPVNISIGDANFLQCAQVVGRLFVAFAHQ